MAEENGKKYRGTFAEKFRNYKKTKEEGDPEVQDMVTDFNVILRELMRQTAQKVMTGQIEMTNANDIARLWAMMEQNNGLLENMNSNGNGMLPELDISEVDSFDKVTDTFKEDIDGEEVYDLENASEDDINKMLQEFDKEQNKENEQSGS